jgi:serine O-acetyltransferase
MIRKSFYFLGQVFFLPHLLLFLTSKEKETIVMDLYARKGTPTTLLKTCYDLSLELLLNPYFRTLFYFRTSGVFSKILRIFYPKHPSFTIDVTCKIAGGLQLAHPYSSILNADSIGKNVYVNHLVTVGEKEGKRPTIGDNVQLHAGSMVLGGIAIGNNAVIGAGTVVVKNVPENATVVGNPARIIESKH